MQFAGAHFLDDQAVLLFHAHFQRFLVLGVHRQQIKIIVGSAMQHSAMIKNRAVDQRMRLAAIFRLDVERAAAESDIAVVAKGHDRCASRCLCWKFAAIVDR